MANFPAHMNSTGRFALVLAALVALGGCADDNADLRARVAEIKSRPGGRIEPLPEVKPYETFAYGVADQRSPFEAGAPAAALAPNALRPVAPEAVSAPVHHGPRVVHHPIPSSDLDPDALKIFRRLTRFDHTAYFVGGCVRDLLLGRKREIVQKGKTQTLQGAAGRWGSRRIESPASGGVAQNCSDQG